MSTIGNSDLEAKQIARNFGNRCQRTRENYLIDKFQKHDRKNRAHALAFLVHSNTYGDLHYIIYLYSCVLKPRLRCTLMCKYMTQGTSLKEDSEHLTTFTIIITASNLSHFTPIISVLPKPELRRIGREGVGRSLWSHQNFRPHPFPTSKKNQS